MPALIACPSCGCRVQVVEFQLGRRVRCIACSQSFVADSTPPPAPPQLHYPLAPGTDPAPAPPPADVRGLPRHRLPLCPSCQRPVGWDAPDCPFCGHMFDGVGSEQGDDWLARRDCLPHRGKLIDGLGTVSMIAGTLTLCLGAPALVAFAAGVPALLMAGTDLEEMRKGRIDPTGRTLTEFGRNKAIVGCVIGVLFGFFWVLWIWNWLR